jgi:capsular exopolysaccharide synthesis family protein
MKPRRQEPVVRLPDPKKEDPVRNRPSDQGKTIGVPLARIVPRTIAQAPELVVATQPRSYIAERFRRLRTALSSRDGAFPKVVLVTSAAPGEGKSVVAANLALALASGSDSEPSVLVDADLRRPSIAQWLLPPPTLGLADLLLGQTTLEHTVISPTNSALNLLPAGDTPSDPSDLLASDNVKRVIDELRQKYARIIIDTPPIVPFTDAVSIGRYADGFLLVVRAGVTRVTAYTQAIELGRSIPLLGTVLNDTEPNLADIGRDYGNEYYRKYYAKDRES